MTVKQVENACKKHNYLLLRDGFGYLMGVNGKVGMMARKRCIRNASALTDYVSYIPCNIDLYIQHKHPFIVP